MIYCSRRKPVSCVGEGFSVVNVPETTCIVIGKEICVVSCVMFWLGSYNQFLSPEERPVLGYREGI
jgi:hypothetical protein